jgi:hypothetical protein
MGARLMRRCLEACVAEKDMAAVSRLTLTCMAAHALDSPGRNPADPVGVYWGGHSQLGIEVCGAFARTTTQRQTIRRAIRDLESRGLIRVYAINPGGRRAYELLPKNPG